MTMVRVKEGESFDGALRRFKRAVEKEGKHKARRRKERYEKKSAQRKRAMAAARKRLLKRLAREKAMWEQSARDRRR